MVPICNTICHVACEPCDAACSLTCGQVLVPAPPPAPPTPPEPPPLLTPLEIMAGSIVAGWDAESLSSSPVAEWPDLGPGGFTLTGEVEQPTWSATGGPNSQPSVLFDGVDDVLVTSPGLQLPIPGDTPTFFWGVLRQVTWTAPDRFWGCEFMDLAQAGGSPDILQLNQDPVNTNAGLPVNAFRRIEVYFSNSTSDYVKAGAVTSTGANSGNTEPAGSFTLGAAAGLSDFGNIEVCELWIFNVEPSPLQKAQLDAYATSRYGPGLV